MAIITEFISNAIKLHPEYQELIEMSPEMQDLVDKTRFYNEFIIEACEKSAFLPNEQSRQEEIKDLVNLTNQKLESTLNAIKAVKITKAEVLRTQAYISDGASIQTILDMNTQMGGFGESIDPRDVEDLKKSRKKVEESANNALVNAEEIHSIALDEIQRTKDTMNRLWKMIENPELVITSYPSSSGTTSISRLFPQREKV